MDADSVQVAGMTFEKMIDSREIQTKVGALATSLHASIGDQDPLFMIILNGAFMFASGFLKHWPEATETHFIKMSSYRGKSSTGVLNIEYGLDVEITDRTVVILEDIVDSAFTMSQFIPLLYEKGARSVQLVSLLVKPKAKKHEVKVHLQGFEIPPAFVIGYGLDYDGQGRNFPSIYQLKDQL